MATLRQRGDVAVGEGARPDERSKTAEIDTGSDLLQLSAVPLSAFALLCVLYYWLISGLGLPKEEIAELWRSRGLPVQSTPPPLHFCTNLDELRQLSDLLTAYTRHNYVAMLVLHAAGFLFLQSTAIPGTIFFNLTGGFLFGMWVGFPLCLVYNTVGSVFMYTLSWCFGRRLVIRFARHRLEQVCELIRRKTDVDLRPDALRSPLARSDGADDRKERAVTPPPKLHYRSRLFVYLVMSRVMPFFPNWAMNMVSPHLGIPVDMFAASVFVGLAAYNFLTCQSGLLLAELTSDQRVVSWRATLTLLVVALLGMLLPSVVTRLGLLADKETEDADGQSDKVKGS